MNVCAAHDISFMILWFEEDDILLEMCLKCNECFHIGAFLALFYISGDTFIFHSTFRVTYEP